AAAITWKRTLETLLADAPDRATRRNGKPRRRITVANTYPVFPPRSGGQARIFNIYGHLAAYHDIELVVFGEPGEPASRREIRPGFTEVRVPFSDEHLAAEKNLREET